MIEALQLTLAVIGGILIPFTLLAIAYTIGWWIDVGSHKKHQRGSASLHQGGPRPATISSYVVAREDGWRI